MDTVPTFSADGTRLRNYNRAALESMAAKGRVAVERNRRGLIVCAHMRPADGANPISKTAHMGQAYSYEQTLPSGHRVWVHTKLLDERNLEAGELADAEAFVRKVYQRVPVSITRAPATPVVCIGEYREKTKRLAPVLCIADFAHRRRKSSSRPIEFDSERRAA